jgi:hypothetical protein
LIVFVIGLPAFIMVFLCRNRWHLENDEDVVQAIGPLFEVRCVILYGSAFNFCFHSTQPYRDDRFFMEPVVLLRRTIIVVLNVSLVLSPRWKYTSFALASLMFFLAHALLSPFRTKARRLLCSLFWTKMYDVVLAGAQRDNLLESLSLLHLLGITVLLTGESPPFRSVAHHSWFVLQGPFSFQCRLGRRH